MILYVSLIIFAMLLPTMAYAFWEEKKGKSREVIFTFSGPDGTKKTLKAKMGYSWSVALTLLIPFAFFRGSAFIFRGQFLHWMGSWLGISMILFYILSLFTANMDLSLNLENIYNTPIKEQIDLVSTGQWIGITILFIMIGLMNAYFAMFANKSKIKSLYKKGFSFDNGQNGDVSDIYEYIGSRKPVNSDDLSPNVKRGDRHNYVVPEKQFVEEEEVTYDSLTTQDLKLLLKSEGVPYHGESDREELLELIEEYIAAPERKEKNQKRIKDLKEYYSKKTIEELIDELNGKGIAYEDDMTKTKLINLLVKNKK